MKILHIVDFGEEMCEVRKYQKSFKVYKQIRIFIPVIDQLRQFWHIFSCHWSADQLIKANDVYDKKKLLISKYLFKSKPA